MTCKVGMVSLGCPKNQMDAELMLAKLEQAGFELVAESGLADVVIVNTCGFIEDAKKESIENILEFAQLKQEGRIQRIIVTGCLAERYQEELVTELPECDGVLGLGANGDIVMEEQTRISDAYNQAQVGKTIPVLVESYDRYAECWFGRSEGDAPDIDGKVFFSCPRGAVQPGRLVQVNITDAMDWDLMGEYVDESAQ